MAFWLTLLVGLAMAGVGFAFSARMGTEAHLDPVLPYSPVLFIAGIITCFMSAVVYEMLPWKAAAERA